MFTQISEPLFCGVNGYGIEILCMFLVEAFAKLMSASDRFLIYTSHVVCNVNGRVWFLDTFNKHFHYFVRLHCILFM